MIPSRKVAIIDYGMGNLRSIFNAFQFVGADPFVAGAPGELAGAERVILPGVGAFGVGMQHLRDQGWIPAMEDEVLGHGKPFLGICLGMQLIATYSEEHGRNEGLNWIPGGVTRLDTQGLPLPHIGWNDVDVPVNAGLYRDLGARETFYFVHSFAFRPDDPSVVTGSCRHGETFAASVARENIHATQYHPEKSHRKGLQLLTAFLEVPARG